MWQYTERKIYTQDAKTKKKKTAFVNQYKLSNYKNVFRL